MMGPPTKIVDIRNLPPVAPLRRKAAHANLQPRPSTEEEERQILARLPGPDPLPSGLAPTSTPAGPLSSISPTLRQRLMTTLLRRGNEEDMATNVSTNGDAEINLDDYDAYSITELAKSFPSVMKVYHQLRKQLMAADLKEACQVGELFSVHISDAARVMNKLPRWVREKAKFEGLMTAVMLLTALFEQDIKSLKVETVTDAKRRCASIAIRLDVLRRAFETLIRTTNNLWNEGDESGTVAAFAQALGQADYAAGQNDSDNIELLLTRLLRSHTGDLKSILRPYEYRPGAESPQTFDVMQYILSQELLHCYSLKQLADTQPKKSKPVMGTSISNRLISANGSVVQLDNSDRESLSGSIKSIFQAIKMKDQSKSKASAEHACKVRKSMLLVDDPLKKKAKIQLPAPTGDAAKMTATQSGIKAITVAGIVYLLTLSSPDKYVPELTATVTTCFRIFTTPREFFAQLVARYVEQPIVGLSSEQVMAWAIESANIRLRIVNILENWFLYHWHRDQDTLFLDEILTFINNRLWDRTMNVTQAERLVGAICHTASLGPNYRPLAGTRKRKEEVIAATRALRPPTTPHFKFDGEFRFDYCVGNPAGIRVAAEQITLLASELYCQLDTEILVKYWLNTADLPSEMAQSIREAVGQDSYLSCMVQHDILSQNTPEARARRVEMWIDIAEQCLAMRNFWGSNAIITACAGSSIRRLRRTVMNVSAAFRTKWHHMDDIFHVKNYAGYRALLKEKELVPTIPLLSALVHDIVHAYEWEVKDKRTDGLFELQRAKTTYATIEAMENCRIPYNFKKRSAIRSYIQWQYKEFAKYGLYKAEQEVLYKYSDQWAKVENKGIVEKGDLLWAQDVPDYAKRNSLVYIFPQD